ncbi:biopolymer transporter ExbD [Lentibacter algarum]|uniref:ExbD/TolR family protein n=1 Tax=Lentibacter algarum TaxID=576131 RepID=UPI001C06D157|nr:biopolymer transporter ExbD [Lentibacter algarum]MBU2980708.1 biopolymer transporter ExbD [Lentibacter algarum]
MDFSQPKQRRQSEPALPMINVVFLLLIFFLMSAQIVAPPPIDVQPPLAQHGAALPDDLRLHIAADGAFALDDLRGPAVWEMLALTPAPAKTAVLVRADATLPAATLASALSRLSALGYEQVQLTTAPK